MYRKKDAIIITKISIRVVLNKIDARIVLIGPNISNLRITLIVFKRVIPNIDWNLSEKSSRINPIPRKKVNFII